MADATNLKNSDVGLQLHSGHVANNESSFSLCPECTNQLYFLEGGFLCPVCGYSIETVYS